MNPSPRHLAIFIRSLRGGGGAERMMVELASAISARGHRVDLVLGRAEGSFLSDVPDRVRLVDLGGGSALRAAAYLLRDPAFLRRILPSLISTSPPRVLACVPALVRYLRTEQPHALLSALNYTNIAALWAKRIARVRTRFVVTERNTLSVRAAQLPGRAMRRLPNLVRHFYPEADGIGAVSDGVADDLASILGLPRTAIVTTFNPVVGPELARRAAEPVDHVWFEGPDPVLLAAGKLKEQKDFPTLLRAFAKLRAERKVRLVILGEGPGRDSLEALALELGVREDVSLPGFVENPFAYMARAAVFVLSSAWEGLPSVLIQAMACGSSVVSTDCPSGPREILQGGVCGPLVPVGDSDAMCQAIRSVLDAPPDRELLRSAAAVFSSESSAERYLDLLLGDISDAVVPPDESFESSQPGRGSLGNRRGLGDR